MSYKKDFFDAFLATKEQSISALLAFAMACLRGFYQGRKALKTLIDAAMCAMIAWFIKDILKIIGLSGDLSYVASVFIGYVGTDFINRTIKRKFNNKLGSS